MDLSEAHDTLNTPYIKELQLIDHAPLPTPAYTAIASSGSGEIWKPYFFNNVTIERS